MVMIDCPWCNETVAVDATSMAIRCDGCAVEVECAADRPDDVALAA